MTNSKFYQDLFQLGGQFQVKPPSQYSTDQQYDFLRSGMNPDAEFEKRYQELIAQGMPPEQAKTMAQQSTSPKSYGNDYEAYLRGEGSNSNVDNRGRLVPGSGQVDNFNALNINQPQTEQDYLQQKSQNTFSSNYPSPYIGEQPLGLAPQEEQTNQMNSQLFMNSLPFLSGTGTDIGTELFMAGNALGTDKGTPGRGLAIASGIGSAIMGGARAGLSGYALAKANETQAEWQRKQLAKGRQGSYTPSPQYGNTNNFGNAMFEDGGRFSNLFQEGGGTPTGMVENPKYLEQMEEYKRSKALGINTKGSTQVDLNSPVAMERRISPTGLKLVNLYESEGSSGYFPEYEKPTQYIPAPVTTSAPQVGGFTTANTGQLMSERGNLDFNGKPLITNRQYSQPIEQIANSPEAVMRRQAIQEEMTRNTNLVENMSEQDKEEARRMKITPDTYMQVKNMSEQDKTEAKRLNLSPEAYLKRISKKVLQDGGRFVSLFQDGGEQQMMQEEGQQPQEGQEEQMMQQVAMMAQQMMSQGATPEQTLQALVQQGVPQEVAQQVIQMIMQQSPQEEGMEQGAQQNQQEEGMESPQMQYGGLFQETNSDPIVKFNKNVGDVVEFEANGKTHKGKIKKIENGKFFI